MASEYTPNYNLDKYIGTDKPNLRDQYNSAMDKIDAQFVVIDNDHTETSNQIFAISTRVTAAEGQIGQTGTELAAVKRTAESANSRANANATAIEGIDANLATVKGNVADLQAANRSQVVYQAQQWSLDAHGLIMLSGMPSSWGSKGTTYTLDAAIPSWANWIDVYLIAQDSTFYKEGAGSMSDTSSFTSPLIVQTFPTKVAKKAASSTAIENRPITDFCVSLPPMMDAGFQGAQTVTFGVIPFRITGKQLTQKMGLAASSGGFEEWKNAFSGVCFKFAGDDPTVTNSQGSAGIYKIVARA